MAPHTIIPGMSPVWVGRCRSPDLPPPIHTHTNCMKAELALIFEHYEEPFNSLNAIPLGHNWRHARQRFGVTGRLDSITSFRSPTVSIQLPTVRVDTTGATFALIIFSLLPLQCVDLGKRMYYVAIQTLTERCRKMTTIVNINASLSACTAILWNDRPTSWRTIIRFLKQL